MAEVGGCPGLEIDDFPLKNSPCSILENLGPCIALLPMRLRHTCKVATNAAENLIIGYVGCSRGSPHTGGIRHNLFEIYYFEKLYAPRARAARARALAPRAKVGGMSQL